MPCSDASQAVRRTVRRAVSAHRGRSRFARLRLQDVTGANADRLLSIYSSCQPFLLLFLSICCSALSAPLGLLAAFFLLCPIESVFDAVQQSLYFARSCAVLGHLKLGEPIHYDFRHDQRECAFALARALCARPGRLLLGGQHVVVECLCIASSCNEELSGEARHGVHRHRAARALRAAH
eukprot:27041-Pleurochrysis_carterae.AAC.3